MKIPTSTKTPTAEFERVHVEEGIYTAELVDVRDISEGQYGPRVAFIYSLPQGKEVALVAYKTRATVNNKLGQTLIAHGAEINDEETDTENLPRKQVKAWIEDYEYDSDGEKKKASIVTKVKSLVEKPGNDNQTQ